MYILYLYYWDTCIECLNHRVINSHFSGVKKNHLEHIAV